MQLYKELAEWWPLFSPVSEYAEEAASLREIIESGGTHPRTMLELGCGGGHIASYFKAHYQLTLMELSASMLACSAAINPECEHLLGDMRTLRLGRTFDAVFVHDAVMYMTTEADLRAAMVTAFEHCAPGGVALFVPDCVRETFADDTETGGSDGPENGVRYLLWSHDPDPTDTTYRTEFVLTLRTGADDVRVVHDRHTEGLFPRATWLRLLSEVGFSPTIVADEWREDLFLAKRP